MLVKLLPGPATVATLRVGASTAEAETCAAFWDGLAGQAGLTRGPDATCDGTIEGCAQAREQLMHPAGRPQGLFLATSLPLYQAGTGSSSWKSAAQANTVKTVVAGIDPAVLRLMKLRLVKGALGALPQEMGYRVTDRLLRSAAGESLEAETLPFHFVCPNNFQEYSAMWGSANFGFSPTPCDL